MRTIASSLLILLLAHATFAVGGTLKIQLPDGTKVTSAAAVAGGLKLEAPGKIDGTTITFDNLLPDTPYDVKLTLADGVTVQGVNLNWYNEDEAKPDAGPITDDDRKEMLGIISIPDFYNKHDVVQLQGTHDRAVALVQLVRDTDFYAGTGQVIWRMELYYFKNQHGGWEKISQQNKILRRERFKTHDLFKSTTVRTKFVAALGGIKLAKEESSKTVKIQSFEPAK